MSIAGQRLWGFDVEANDKSRPWDGATTAVVMSEDGDEERFQGGDCLERLARHMQRARGTYCGHYAGGYDTPLLLNHWRPKKIVLSGSIILLAEDAADLQVRDTFPWWLASLAKVGEAVGVEKWDVDRAQMERLSLEEESEYCAQDVRVELAGVQAARAFLRSLGAKQAWTAGQSAASIVCAVEPGTWRALERNRCDVDEVMEFLASGACRAGRIECGARGVVEGVYCYDVKSSYPARYANDDVGVGLKRADADDLRRAAYNIGVYLCRWRWLDRKRVPPALDNKTMCGVGDCESWLTNDEVARFEQCGVSVRVVEGWVPREILPVAQAFAKLMFGAKEGTGPERFFSKVWLNAWLGKTAMSPLREHFTSWSPKEYWAPAGAPKPVPEGPNGSWWHRYYTIDHDKQHLCKPYQQPLLASVGFGRARAGLWDIDDAVYRVGFPVLYNDTDSLFTTAKPHEMAAALGKPLGTDLGDLAFDGGPYTGYFLGPKAYLLVDEHGVVKKCALKGVPHRAYADGIIEPGTGLVRDARGQERLRGTGPFTRKGNGRDVRVELFERALGPQRRDVRSTAPSGAGSIKCVKDGLSTFLRGVRGTDDEGPGRWKRAPVVRTVRPSGRGKVHLTPTSFEYLAVVEISMMKFLRALPMPESRMMSVDPKTGNLRTPAAARELALRGAALPEGEGGGRGRGPCFIEIRADERSYASLPREEHTLPSGRRVRRASLWAAYRELQDTAGVTDHDGAMQDRLVRGQHLGRGDGPGPWRGGELDGFRRELGALGRLVRSPYEGFYMLCRKARLWRDLARAMDALREFPGLERMHIPAELLGPQKSIVHLTPHGQAWLDRVTTVYDPEDEEIAQFEEEPRTRRADDSLDDALDDPPF